MDELTPIPHQNTAQLSVVNASWSGITLRKILDRSNVVVEIDMVVSLRGMISCIMHVSS